MNKAIILFADNDSRFLKIRKEFLDEEGYQVVTATNPVDARKILEKGKVDIAILDIRMIEDRDERDLSGLILAKETARNIPKIILTGFPTWDAVRDALGIDLNGLPPAVDFIWKGEGPEAMLRSIALILRKPELRGHLLNAFDVQNIMALPTRIADLGPEEASNRFHRSFMITSEQLTKYREQENLRASQYHFWGLSMAVLGMLLILATAVMILLNRVESPTLPLVGSVLSETVSILFFVREDKGYKRVNAYFAQLNELNNLGNLLEICDSLHSPSDREEFKKKIIEKVVERWFGA
jgi:CheY-like chemotaxis protein